jgi:hypothetical protein
VLQIRASPEDSSDGGGSKKLRSVRLESGRETSHANGARRAKPFMFPSLVRRRSKPVPFGEIAYPEAHRQSPQRFSGSRVEMRTAARR